MRCSRCTKMQSGARNVDASNWRSPRTNPEQSALRFTSLEIVQRRSCAATLRRKRERNLRGQGEGGKVVQCLPLEHRMLPMLRLPRRSIGSRSESTAEGTPAPCRGSWRTIGLTSTTSLGPRCTCKRTVKTSDLRWLAEACSLSRKWRSHQ